MWSRPTSTSKFRDDLRFDRIAIAMIQGYLLGKGRATTLPGGLHAFIKSEPQLPAPDIEFMFPGTPPDAHIWFPGIRPAFEDGFGIRPALLHPASRGDVRLRSADPKTPPIIRYNFLEEPSDLAKLREGVLKEATPQQVAEANRRAVAWMKRPPIERTTPEGAP